jgi:AraC family transcriptional regulator of adaptative response/methylated-DNA-[protein]-cysteine methyltransferase
MVAVAGPEGLSLLEFADRRGLEAQIASLRKRLGCTIVPGVAGPLDAIADELARYFAGTLTRFTVPLELAGTPFQVAVWHRLMRIPSGETLSYGQLAEELGRPGAQRAVGRANGDNRLAIVVPCHRVVRADGSLCGYGGGSRDGVGPAVPCFGPVRQRRTGKACRGSTDDRMLCRPLTGPDQSMAPLV